MLTPASNYFLYMGHAVINYNNEQRGVSIVDGGRDATHASIILVVSFWPTSMNGSQRFSSQKSKDKQIKCKAPASVFPCSWLL